MADNNDEDKGIEPDAWRLFAGKNDKYLNIAAETNSEIHTGKPSEMTDNVRKEWEPLYGAETILWLWKDDFKKSILGEVDELRERGVAEDVAEQLEHAVKRFEEVFSDEQ